MGIDRVGQKVICITDVRVSCDHGCAFVRVPVIHEVYTVSRFEDFKGDKGSVPGLHLVELPGVECQGSNVYCSARTKGPFSWLMVLFKPVDERQTDISNLVAIADKVSRKGLVDA